MKRYSRSITISSLVLFLAMLITPLAQAATLVWNSSSGTVDGYKIYYGTTPSNRSQSIDVGKATSYNLNRLPLTENTTYYISVSAYNAAGESAPCTPVVYTPGDTTPPSPPSGVTAN